MWVAATAGTVAANVEIMANPAKSAKAGMGTIRKNDFMFLVCVFEIFRVRF
jgi:hypothetical protein